MITATIRPISHTAELSLEIYRNVLALARSEQAKVLQRSRKRAKAYAKKARQAGYQEGLKTGLQESRQGCHAALDGIRTQYVTAVELAKRDVNEVAYHIVENLISSTLEQHPEQLRHWIVQSLESLKSVRNITLRYNPRYYELLNSFAEKLPSNLQTISDSSLGPIDFTLETSTGGLTFSWREMLRPLSPPQSSL